MITATNRFSVVVTNQYGKLAFAIEASEPSEAIQIMLKDYYSGYFTQIETAPIFELKPNKTSHENKL